MSDCFEIIIFPTTFLGNLDRKVLIPLVMKEFIIKHFFSNSLLPITAIFIITTVFVLFKPNRFLSVLFYQLTDYDFSLRILDINQYVGCLIYVAFAYYYVFLVPTITFYLYFNFTHSLTNNENSRF